MLLSLCCLHKDIVVAHIDLHILLSVIVALVLFIVVQCTKALHSDFDLHSLFIEREESFGVHRLYVMQR